MFNVIIPNYFSTLTFLGRKPLHFFDRRMKLKTVERSEQAVGIFLEMEDKNRAFRLLNSYGFVTVTEARLIPWGNWLIVPVAHFETKNE